MAEEKWLYPSGQTKSTDTLRTAIYTHPEQVFYQPRPWIIHCCGKLAARRNDALRCSGDNRIVLELFSEILIRHVVVRTIVGFVESGKLQIAALLRTLAIDVFDVVYGRADDGVQGAKGSKGHGGRLVYDDKPRQSFMSL